jgi:hypothetical protein
VPAHWLWRSRENQLGERRSWLSLFSFFIFHFSFNEAPRKRGKNSGTASTPPVKTEKSLFFITFCRYSVSYGFFTVFSGIIHASLAECRSGEMYSVTAPPLTIFSARPAREAGQRIESLFFGQI